MSVYTDKLKQLVDSIVKSNNNQEITGQLLQRALNAMIDATEETYQLVDALKIGGIALLQQLGDSTTMGISQKVITAYLTSLQNQINTENARAIEAEQALHTELAEEATRATEREDSLQEQIDAIVSKDTTVGLSVSPAVVFADGTDKVVTFVATSSPTKATVVFDGGEPQEGTRLEFPVTVNSATPTTVTKTAQFTVQGVSKGSKSATVALVFPVYYGAGQSADVLNTEAMTAHSAVAAPAFIQSITTADNDYIFFEVPNDMANIQRLQLWDDPSFPTDLSIEAVETPREGYKAFKTVNSRLAGTHTYKVS